MDNVLIIFIIFDLIMLFFIYRFMAKKLNSKLAIVEERQRARWAKDEAKLSDAFSKNEEE